MSALLDRCLCRSPRFEADRIHYVRVHRCTDCGIVRQFVLFGAEELSAWYRDAYHSGHYTHSYAHDLVVANVRLDGYGIASGAKLLDVGCGLHAFVDAAKARGIEAIGQDLASASASDDVYVGDLADVAFPTDSFDVVTMHDVLEHFVDPAVGLKEARRVLRRPGKLIVDFPRFWHESGKHHWKRIEHLWMLTEEQLIQLAGDCGFRVTSVHHPIPSKVVIEAEPLPEKRPQVLVPSGIGDAFWAITKVPGLLKSRGLGMPDVWVQDSGGPKRTQPYLKNLPFINAPGYKVLSDRDPIFHEAYMQNGRTIFPNVLGVDYFVAYNGIMRAGRSLEEVDVELGCEWHPKLHVSKAAQKMRERMAGPGRYLLTYWAEAGMYRRWLNDFSAVQICEALRRIRRELDLRVVFMGSPWDRGQVGRAIADMDPSFENLIGSTSFDQMLGCILGATAVLGFPAGNTILAAALNVPTALMWNKYFDSRFWKHACPPDANYVPLDTCGLTQDVVVGAVRDGIERDSRGA